VKKRFDPVCIMNLDTLADYAEIFGAIGVIASLLYVGYQIRETRRAVRAQTAQARTDLGVQLISSRYTTNIADLLVKSLEHPETLTAPDRFRLASFFSAHVRHCQNLYYQQQQGLLDEYFGHGVARVAAYWIRNYPWAVGEWEKASRTLPPEFVAYINQELEQHPENYDG